MIKQKQLPALKPGSKPQEEALPDGRPAKKELQKYTPEETRNILLVSALPNGDLGLEIKKFGEEILPKYLHGNEKERKLATEKYNEKALELMTTMETDTHVGLMETFSPRYRGLARELSYQFAQDYKATANAEKALAEIAANAFVRIIDNSRRLNNCMETSEYISEDRTKYLAMLSKQIDRANRQFLSSLMALKQLRAPMIEMNIKTNTAFVSQNQQINMPQANNENNEPK